ncbi:MAG: PadR family transcriptional regulator [Gemmatimonadota bacterium]
MTDARGEVARGALELLVLKTLLHEPMHGWGVSQLIQQHSEGVLEVNQGSLYPALQRLEEKGWIRSEWGTTENNRRARFYSLTERGRAALTKETASWRRYVGAVDRILAMT